MFETILAQYMFDAYIAAMFKVFFPPILPQYRPNTVLKFNLIIRQYDESTNIAYIL